MSDLSERLRSSVTKSGGIDLRDPGLLFAAADELARLQEAKRAALKVADERSKENVALRQALKAAQQKLVIYREGSNGEYKGGMEYTGLMQMIDRALEQRGVPNRIRTGVLTVKG